MISIEQPVSVIPDGGALPLSITLGYALRATGVAQQVTVSYELESSHDVYFATGGGLGKTFMVTWQVSPSGMQFQDGARLVRGPSGEAVQTLLIHQTIRDESGAELHASCRVRILESVESAAYGWVGEERTTERVAGEKLFRDGGLRRTLVPRERPRAGTQRAAARRYVNAALVESHAPRRLSPTVGIAPGQTFRIRLDIGTRSRSSQIERPLPLPELPDDVWLDAMLASSHFAVGADRRDLGKAPVAHGRFFLRGGAGAAKTPSGSRYLFFWLRAPQAPAPGPAVARVSFYYRNAVVQSLRLAATIGGSQWTLAIDYTMVEALGDLRLIPDRPRLSVVTNDNGGGRHQVTVRSARGDAPDATAGATFELDEKTIGDVVRELRATLRRVAPLTRQRSRGQLIEDLRQLAPVGWKLHYALAGQFTDTWDRAREAPDDLVIQVSRPQGASYALPWGLLYEILLDSGIEPRKLRVCDLVERWDGKAPLVTGFPRECPHAAEPYHRENVLCPFGFWGLRYSLEQLTSTDRPVPEIPGTTEPIMVAGLTEYDVDTAELSQHLQRLRSALESGIPNAQLQEGRTRQAIRGLLGQDLALVYFYCHGERLDDGNPDTFLGVGRREQITPGDFIGWVQRWRQDKKKVWDRIRPLIFVNACHSVEINPDTLVSYLDAFVGTGRAAGLIGTEVKVSQALAMELAIDFFQRFSRPDCSVDRALREVRLEYLRAGNLVGLVYTPYCWADLHLTR